MIPPLPELLPAEVLLRRQSLPLKPAAVTLTGRYVKLAPTDIERDAAALFAVSNGSPATLGARSIDAYDAEAMIWRFMADGPYATLAEFRAGLQARATVSNALALTVFDQATGQPVGVTNLMSNSPEHLKIELGGIWYSPLAQRTLANTEATYLMLKHAFGLGYLRVEWKCHVANERSRRAALRMGFQFEGIQESHMIIKNRLRDTAWYRILASEWPVVAARLEGML